MRTIMGHTTHYKRMIIMLQMDSSILYLSHWAGYFILFYLLAAGPVILFYLLVAGQVILFHILERK